jgi:hypothetical protein
MGIRAGFAALHGYGPSNDPEKVPIGECYAILETGPH